MKASGVTVCLLVALAFLPAGARAVQPGASTAGGWLPHPADATWTYSWSDTAYATTPTSEQVSVKSSRGSTFELGWTTDGLDNPPDAVSTSGTIDFQETETGLVNTNWSSSPPPTSFPILCSQQAGCGNALTSVYFNVIWGSRQPVLPEPLIAGMSWSSTGGAANDVTSTSTYLGHQRVSVPAFPAPVEAAVVRSTITQAGALGDPYGSGGRTIWWVYGVGPVKIVFQHAGGGTAPVTTVMLQSTNRKPASPPSDVDYFPFTKNLELKYRWTNTKYLKKPEVEAFTIDAVVNNTARYTVKSVSGPLKVAGTYGFSKRLEGVINLWGNTSSATALKFPSLGPEKAAAAQHNHFVTPFDLMNFGFNPILNAYPAAGDSWTSARPSFDFTTYGVTGKTSIVGLEKVKVPAGSFTALVVKSTLRQPGYPYGSGTRTCWFAPGKGLVKLVFTHADGSVSTVELVN